MTVGNDGAGIGGLAYAGIPATSRGTNSAIAFVTGHDASGDVPDSVDWENLANEMSVAHVHQSSPAVICF